MNKLALCSLLTLTAGLILGLNLWLTNMLHDLPLEEPIVVWPVR
ncbi:hypothetical protein ABID08_004499 [Rhizobium binae]|uniref:Uncharacterized protein n=1 Tax=Rhizobium binae TaxID=1138190 RepID=A0ABV2MKY2_9HYPH